MKETLREGLFLGFSVDLLGFASDGLGADHDRARIDDAVFAGAPDDGAAGFGEDEDAVAVFGVAEEILATETGGVLDGGDGGFFVWEEHDALDFADESGGVGAGLVGGEIWATHAMHLDGLKDDNTDERDYQYRDEDGA